ncbi:MAG: sel1 repeat family protein [Gammaproteobacteria bacterium]|nr:sel1 repeat family protein [Gammaproteobacteria bacterium]
MKKLLPLAIALFLLVPVLASAMPTVKDIHRHGIISLDQIATLYTQAKKGDAFSQAELGASLLNGSLGMLPNMQKAFYWINKAAAQDSAYGYFLLANMSLHGSGVSHDCSKYYEYVGKGIKVYRQKVAQHAYTKRQRAEVDYYVANLYFWGVSGAVKQNLATAFALYKESAEDGFVHSMQRVEFMYRYGLGVKQNLPKAHKWALLLARVGSPEAEYIVGRDYLYGLGVSKDKARAILWLRRSALRNYMPAIENLAHLNKLQQGSGPTTKDNISNVLDQINKNIVNLRSRYPAAGKF